MFIGWDEAFLAGIITVNQILTAGIAITAFSLLLYALSFNLRDRVARSFAVILVCVVVIFSSEALASTVQREFIDDLMRLQWVGLVFLPAGYLQLSDALLVTAGRPSRGRRRIAVRVMYAFSFFFLALLFAIQRQADKVPQLDQFRFRRVGHRQLVQGFVDGEQLVLIRWRGQVHFLFVRQRVPIRQHRAMHAQARHAPVREDVQSYIREPPPRRLGAAPQFRIRSEFCRRSL